MARRLLLLTIKVTVTKTTNSLLVYDHQTLLDLQFPTGNLLSFERNGENFLIWFELRVYLFPI